MKMCGFINNQIILELSHDEFNFIRQAIGHANYICGPERINQLDFYEDELDIYFYSFLHIAEEYGICL